MLKKIFMSGLLAVVGSAMLAGSALAWTEAGDHELNGSLTSTLSTGATLTCSLTFDVTLKTGGTGPPSNAVVVTNVTVTTNPCTTNLVNCSVTVVANLGLPWDGRGRVVATASGDVSVRNGYFKATFEHTNTPDCVQVGLVIEVAGSVVGAYDTTVGGGTLTFTAADGLQVFDGNSAAVAFGSNDSLAGSLTFATATGADLQ